MVIKAAFWDIDGVVVLSEPLHMEKIVRTAGNPRGADLPQGAFDKKFGVHIDLRTHWESELAGKGDHRIYEWITQKNPAFPLTEEQFLAACEHYYLSNAHRLEVRPTFLDAFNYLKDSGLPMAAVSSGVRAQVDHNLAAANIVSSLLFSHSADEVEIDESGKKLTKPHHAPYTNGLKTLNRMLREQSPHHVDIRPEECLVVEDSGSGVTAGHTAGMKTVHWTLEDGIKHHPNASYKIGPRDSLFDLVGNELVLVPTYMPVVTKPLALVR